MAALHWRTMGKRIEKVSNMKTEPEVGKRYRVLCITSSLGLLPILGEAHNDYEFFDKFDKSKYFAENLISKGKHFHPDFRFVEAVEIQRLDKFSRDNFLKWNLPAPPYFWESIHTIDESTSRPFYKNIVCLRRMPTWRPSTKYSASWTLEQIFQEAKIDPIAPRCPHQGTDLSSLPCLRRGNDILKVCPAHGLSWNCQTGKMVSQAEIPLY